MGYVDSFSTIDFSYRLGVTTVREIVYDTCDMSKNMGDISTFDYAFTNNRAMEKYWKKFYEK